MYYFFSRIRHRAYASKFEMENWKIVRKNNCNHSMVIFSSKHKLNSIEKIQTKMSQSTSGFGRQGCETSDHFLGSILNWTSLLRSDADALETLDTETSPFFGYGCFDDIDAFVVVPRIGFGIFVPCLCKRRCKNRWEMANIWKLSINVKKKSM